MRLLNTTTLAQFEFIGDNIPDYAILSHRWEDGEVTFQDLQQGKGPSMHGWSKIKQLCSRARAEGLEWAWIDTCCIDKSSSAELSESINSMFRYYAKSKICYAYLSDIAIDMRTAMGDSTAPEKDSIWPFLNNYILNDELVQGFQRSQWFTRGWTLQELIAPRNVVFLDCDWRVIGTRQEVRDALRIVTGIHPGAYDTLRLRTFSIAQKMSWASSRETTRGEDLTYSLMGIFDVNMPLLYGEGVEKAFRRLQLEIMQGSDDESIFAWDNPSLHDQLQGGPLATSPAAFKDTKFYIPHEWQKRRAYAMTNKGLNIELPMTLTLERPFPNVEAAPRRAPMWVELARFHNMKFLATPINCRHSQRKGPVVLFLAQSETIGKDESLIDWRRVGLVSCSEQCNFLPSRATGYIKTTVRFEHSDQIAEGLLERSIHWTALQNLLYMLLVESSKDASSVHNSIKLGL